MNDEQQAVQRDLIVLEEMVAEMDGYLMSEATHWTMARGDMPKLTIGGCLMRQHRLQVLRGRLQAAEQTRLDTAVESFNQTITSKVVRFEQRTHRELHDRLSEWSGYLRALPSRAAAKVDYYARVADTRVVMAAMIDRLQQPPYKLDPHIPEELAQLDQNLHGRWQAGEFIWTAVWQPAYPPENYWWLYGKPK